MRHFPHVLFLAFAGFVILAGPLCAWSQTSETSGIHRPVTTQELDQLKRRILAETGSSFEGLFEYHNESGDANNRLDFFRVGGGVNLRLSSETLLQIRGTHTPYSAANSFLTEWGTNVTIALKSQLTEGSSLHIEAGGTAFSTDRHTINALGVVGFSSGNRTITFTGRRSNVEESLLSVTGVRPVTGPFDGEIVGQVMDNRFVVDGIVQLLPKLDVFADGGIGVREGSNVEWNFFQVLGGGAGYNFLALADDEPLRLVRASYAANYLHFDKNLGGFGGASLVDRRGRRIDPGRIGSDAISPAITSGQAGVGGYFSPPNYFSHVIRGDVGGRPTPLFEYEVSAFVGSQYYTGASRRPANGFSATVTLRLSDRYSLPVSFLKDNFGPYSQQSLFARLIARF
jgi:hypothetical protein